MTKVYKNCHGFTLIELMITLAISGVIMSAIYSAYLSQQRTYLAQEQVAEVQQNLRACIDYMVRDLRMAGFDPDQSGNFSITDVRSRDLDNVIDAAGNPAITFQADLNENGVLDANETLSYSLYQYPVGAPADQDGVIDLSWTQGGGGRQLLGESIVAMGLAYSYVDASGDVAVDGGNVIWAIDSDNDNDLDLNIDTNKDGIIDISDDATGAALPVSDISIKDIVAVKIWLLAQTGQMDRNYQETQTFVVANQRITPGNKFRHRLVEMTVKCRNLGL